MIVASSLVVPRLLRLPSFQRVHQGLHHLIQSRHRTGHLVLVPVLGIVSCLCIVRVQV